MPSATDFLTFLLAFTILGFVVLILLKWQEGKIFKNRLKDLISYKETLLHEEEKDVKKVYKGFQRSRFYVLRKFIDRIQRSGSKEQEEIRKLFLKAGFSAENAVFIYGISKIGLTLILGGVTTLIVFTYTDWELLYKVVIIVGIALMGSYLVDLILYKLVKGRQARISKAFPDVLDLMVLCTESGLSLAATVQRVAQEIGQISPDLGYELALLSIELNMLSDRQKALQNFSDRLDSTYFKSIISNIQQSEQYGTPIAQTMRVVSEQFRQDRLVAAEERATKLPVLLTLPMMLFIFPCIYIFIAGPAVIQVLGAIGH
jgi:tight adherence protein C